jgi:hypothetical protein
MENPMPPNPTQQALPNVESLLKEAFERRLSSEIKPITQLLGTVRQHLNTYEVQVKTDVKQQAIGAMLAAIGEPPPPFPPKDTSVEVELRTCLLALLELIGDPPPLLKIVSTEDEEGSLISGPDFNDEDTGPEKLVAVTEWSNLPLLRAKEKCCGHLSIVGGLKVKEKIDLIRKKFGFEVEWFEIHADGRHETDAVVQRIRNGSISAVILLEGFLPHKSTDAVVDACRGGSFYVPLAYGGRGGVGTLERAINDLETQLAKKNGETVAAFR